MTMCYTYLGDGLSDKRLRGLQCDPVRRGDGKCIVGGQMPNSRRKMPSSLVVDADGKRHVVLLRRLRLNSKLTRNGAQTMTPLTELDNILALCRARKYHPTGIRETDGQYTVFVDSRQGVTDTTLAKRFADSGLRVVGYGRENENHYILLRVRSG